MHGHKISAAPDYTNAALVSFAINLAWIVFAIWAAFGLVPVLLLAMMLNHLISRLQARRRG